MPYLNENTAYDLSLFETATPAKKQEKLPAPAVKSPKKTEIIDIKQIKTDSKPEKKKSPLTYVAYTFMLLLTASAVIAMLCGQAELTELNQKITEANTILNEKESVYIQTQMHVEAELSPEVVEHYAENVLGMTKIDNSKKEFIKLSEGDKVTIAQSKSGTFGEFITDKIVSMWE